MARLRDLLRKGRHITRIDGINYDITNFVDKHPGGDIIKGIANGNDGSAMFHSSHLRLPNLERMPGVRRIFLEEEEIVTSPLGFSSDKSDFYNVLKVDVENYFTSHQIDYTLPTLTAQLLFWFNMCLFFNFMYLSYVEGWSIFSVLMGILSWNFAGTLVHDHGAHRTTVSKKNWWSNFGMSALASVCFPGAFETHFLYSHYAHHTMVHHEELDSDENLIYPLMRLHEKYPRWWFHRYQHYYWPIAFAVYLFSYIGQTFLPRNSNWWKRHNHLYRPTKSFKFKLLLVSFFVVHLLLPVYFNGLRGLLCYLIFLLTYSMGGFFFATVNHYVGNPKEGTEGTSESRRDWAYHTAIKSGDYLVESTLAHYISGGFNVHGLHHLFPSIHPSHLSSIYHLYEIRCLEHNIPYVRIESWRQLFRTYLENIRRLGSE